MSVEYPLISDDPNINSTLKKWCNTEGYSKWRLYQNKGDFNNYKDVTLKGREMTLEEKEEFKKYI